MRAHLFAGIVLGAAAALVGSAAALARAPIPSPSWTAPVPAAIANATATPTATPNANANATPTPTATDAGAIPPDAGATPTDAGAPDALPPDDTSVPLATDADTAVTPLPLPPPPPNSVAEVVNAGYEPSDVGFAIGLRGGYGVPFGTAGVNKLTDVVTGLVPIGVNVGWFLNRHVYIGGYFQYGFALGVGNNLADCTTYTCSVSTLRFGAVVHYHFRPETQWDPWAGGGLGYDILNTEEDDDVAGDIQQSGAAHGFVFNLETGIDFKPLKYVGLGPYVELTSGHYSSDISSTSLHEWLTFGLRLRTNL